MFEQPFIVIFGAAVREDGTPSGALRDRVGAAVRFGRRVLPRPIFIVTGGQGRYGRHEAEVMADLLVDRGISPEFIVLERSGRNTFRSALAVARILRGAKGPVFAATSSYHMPRAVLLLGITGLDAHRSPPAIGPASSRRMRRWWWRIREFPAIPIDAVLMAWLRVRQRIHQDTLPQPEAHTVKAHPIVTRTIEATIIEHLAPAAEPIDPHPVEGHPPPA